MPNDQNRQKLEATQTFTPDFGNAFDDYGEYREPVTEAPVREVRRPRHVKRLRFPRLAWIALAVVVAVMLGKLAAKWGWRWADDVLALTRPDEDVEVIINESDDLDEIAATL